jgi:hypothetical protein
MSPGPVVTQSGRVVDALKHPIQRRRAAAELVRQTADTRARIRLMITITARDGAYRKGLLAAARLLSPEEAVIVADLERHGLQVPQLRDILHGGHVIVDNPELYTDWRFERVSHLRISSHHRDIDKRKYPDIGMRGVLVREKLHGRTAQGTWLQLEKTPAAFGAKKLPTLDDVRHLLDYVTYRLTRSNVGPWGLSRSTERHPIYLSPDLSVPTRLSPPVAASLATALHRIEAEDDTTAASAALARRFAPPERADPVQELGRTQTGRGGRGLFGNSQVWVTKTSSPAVAVLLRPPAAPAWTEDWPAGKTTHNGGQRD